MQDLNDGANSFLIHSCSVLDSKANALKVHINIRPLLWWDKECYRLNCRMKYIRQYLRKRKYKQTRRGIPYTPFDKPKYTYKDYIEVRKTFKRYCRKVKRRFWHRHMANIPDSDDTAKLRKRLGRENNATMGLFTKSDGTKCTPEESADRMIAAHFPNSLQEPPHTVRRPLRDWVDISDPRAVTVA